MQRGVLCGNNIHDGAQLDCAVSYAAQHLWSLWVLDLDAYISFLSGVLLQMQSQTKCCVVPICLCNYKEPHIPVM